MPCRASRVAGAAVLISVIGSVGAEGPVPDVIELWRSGPNEATVTLVLLGEGYTAKQHGAFEADARRLAREVVSGTHAPFAFVAPLVNVFGIFQPSESEGVPARAPGATAFRTFRESNHLRSILPAADSYATARRVCAERLPRCDYLTILVNDPYYGGLGDWVIIATASATR